MSSSSIKERVLVTWRASQRVTPFSGSLTLAFLLGDQALRELGSFLHDLGGNDVVLHYL